MADALPTELFTWASLGTFTGLTGATVVVTNTAARAFDWSPRWLGLAIALVLCIGLAVANKSPLVDYLLALLNGCLVYLTAGGASAAGAVVVAPKPDGNLESLQKPRPNPFLRKWF